VAVIGALIAKRKVAAAFEALNRQDLAGFMSGWRDDGVFIYPGDIPESGTYRGKAAVEAWFRHFLEQFPVLRFEVQAICVRNIFDLVGNNVIAACWTRQMTNRSGREAQDRGVSVVTAKLGKVVSVEDFFFDLGDDFRRNWSAV
jgi:ketosteroid isomerase-like protein